MESNWRFNIWEDGLSFDEVELDARVVGIPNVRLIKFPPIPDFAVFIKGPIPPTGIWTIDAVLTKFEPNFPYGYLVEPDQP